MCQYKHNQTNEKCVLCGKDTEVPKSLYIGLRKHYIAGVGELCANCFAELYKKQINEELLNEKL